MIPHTSGVVSWWNEPENVERAREFLTALANEWTSTQASSRVVDVNEATDTTTTDAVHVDDDGLGWREIDGEPGSFEIVDTRVDEIAVCSCSNEQMERAGRCVCVANATGEPPSFKLVAAGDYETADGMFNLRRLLDTYPPAWNVEWGTEFVNARINANPENVSGLAYADLIVDGAASKADAVALFHAWWDETGATDPRTSPSDAGGSVETSSTGTTKEDSMSGTTAPDKKNRRLGPKERQAREQREQAAATAVASDPIVSADAAEAARAIDEQGGKPNGSKPKATTPSVDAPALYKALIERVKGEIDGAKLVENKKRGYTAVEVEGKNVGYVALGKRGVSVQIRKGKKQGTTKVTAEREFGAAIKSLAAVAAEVQKAASEGKETVEV